MWATVPGSLRGDRLRAGGGTPAPCANVSWSDIWIYQLLIVEDFALFKCNNTRELSACMARPAKLAQALRLSTTACVPW